jgi:hypothetical protein
MIRLGFVIQALCLLAAVVMGLTYKRLSRRSADVRPRLLPIREPSPNYVLHSNQYPRGGHSRHSDFAGPNSTPIHHDSHGAVHESAGIRAGCGLDT